MAFTWFKSTRPRTKEWKDHSFQKQCKDKVPHVGHFYDRDNGLVWWCQGKGERIG